MSEIIKLLIIAFVGRKIFEFVSIPFTLILMELGMNEEDAIKEGQDAVRWGFSFILIVICIIAVLLFFGIDPFYLASTPPEHINAEIVQF